MTADSDVILHFFFQYKNMKKKHFGTLILENNL